MSSSYTFQAAASLALENLSLPRRYSIDPQLLERAAQLPYTNLGGLEWRAEGSGPVDLISGAQRSNHFWPAWWSHAMPPQIATPPAAVHEAWLEQDASSPSDQALAPGFFWGFDSPPLENQQDEAPCTHPQLPIEEHLDRIGRVYPAFQPVVIRTKALLRRGIPIRWVGIFPSRDEHPALRLNLSHQHPSALEALLDEAPPSFRRLYTRVHAALDDQTEVAWCWDQSDEGPSRLMAELTPRRELVGLQDRQAQLARILTRFGARQPWLEDALTLNQQFHSYDWALPPDDERALLFCLNLLLAPKSERPQLLRYLSHLKVELDLQDPEGPYKAKLYGIFSLPGSGLARSPNGSDTPVWPELADALRNAPWPPTIATLQTFWPPWTHAGDDTILHELRQRAQLHLAETLLRDRR